MALSEQASPPGANTKKPQLLLRPLPKYDPIGLGLNAQRFGRTRSRGRGAALSAARESIERSMTLLQMQKSPGKHRGFFKIWCQVSESNQGHEDFQSSALPTELTGLRKQFVGNLREARIKAFE